VSIPLPVLLGYDVRNARAKCGRSRMLPCPPHITCLRVAKSSMLASHHSPTSALVKHPATGNRTLLSRRHCRQHTNYSLKVANKVIHRDASICRSLYSLAKLRASRSAAQRRTFAKSSMLGHGCCRWSSSSRGKYTKQQQAISFPSQLLCWHSICHALKGVLS
jgi:hypothetical protein